MKKHQAPIIAAILLLLPVVYVGAYLALVEPEGVDYEHQSASEGFTSSQHRIVIKADSALTFSGLWSRSIGRCDQRRGST